MENGYKLKDFFDTRGLLKVKRLYNGRMVPDPVPLRTNKKLIVKEQISKRF